jgi:prepilin-type N-terminal cleavage/methylation domain-containing protein
MSSRLHHSVASFQLPVASGETAHSSISASRRLRVPASSPGFTLVEMLVVMGIIVLAITLAIPTIRYLTGSKSQQGAENTMAAMLARTRSDAIGLQQPQGVLFLLDQASGRVELVEVMQTIAPYDPPGVVYLDLVPDRDPLFLPPGIGAWTIKDTYVPSGVGDTDPFVNYRYLGYNNDTTTNTYTNTVITDRALIGGVILFDGQGNLLVTPYGFRFLNTISTPATPTSMAGALITIPPSSLPPGLAPLWPTSTGPLYPPTIYLRSQLGFVLFDKESFENQERLISSSLTNLEGNPLPSSTSNEGVLDPWLDVNTTPLLVNRYDGTLTRAE